MRKGKSTSKFWGELIWTILYLKHSLYLQKFSSFRFTRVQLSDTDCDIPYSGTYGTTIPPLTHRKTLQTQVQNRGRDYRFLLKDLQRLAVKGMDILPPILSWVVYFSNTSSLLYYTYFPTFSLGPYTFSELRITDGSDDTER